MTKIQVAPEIILDDYDRSKNLLVTGTPGTGVTQLLFELINQDIQSGQRIVLFDPYGDLADKVLGNLDDNSLEKTVYINWAESKFPVGLNLFAHVGEDEKQEVSQLFIDLMYDLYDPERTGIVGPRFEHAVRNAILTILYNDNPTVIELLRCLTDADYVNRILPKVSDEVVKNYWNKQIAQTSDFHKSEVLDYIVSKLSLFVSDRSLRLCLNQYESKLDLNVLLEDKQIILFDFGGLRKQKETMKIVSSILVYKLLKKLKSQKSKSRMSLYFDEARFWPASELAKLLEEGRRVGVNTTVTTMAIAEVEKELKKNLFRLGSLVSFRTQTADAQVLAPEFHSEKVTVNSLCLMNKFHILARVMQGGNVKVFDEALSLEREETADEMDGSKVEAMKEKYRQQYGVPAEEVETSIQKRMKK